MCGLKQVIHLRTRKVHILDLTFPTSLITTRDVIADACSFKLFSAEFLYHHPIHTSVVYG